MEDIIKTQFIQCEIKKSDLPIFIKYGDKEYILKATPKGLLMTKKEY